MTINLASIGASEKDDSNKRALWAINKHRNWKFGIQDPKTRHIYPLKNGEEIQWIQVAGHEYREGQVLTPDGNIINLEDWMSQQMHTRHDVHEVLNTANNFSEVVFKNIWNKLKGTSGAVTSEDRWESVKKSIERTIEFNIKPIIESGLTNVDIKSKFIQSFSDHSATPEANALLNEMFSRIDDLVKHGEVSPLVAKSYLYRLLRGMALSGNFYNDIIRYPESLTSEQIKEINNKTLVYTTDLWNAYPKNQKIEQSGFYHFNPGLSAVPIMRVYLSANLSHNPEKFFEAWNQVMSDPELKNAIYYKSTAGAAYRYEHITLYPNKDTDPQKIEKILTKFIQICPPESLLNDNLPTGIPLKSGITLATAAESQLNNILKNLNKPSISYNLLIDNLISLALEITYHQHKSSNPHKQLLPRDFKEFAQSHFQELLKLAGINPKNMLQYTQGDTLPDWAQKIQSL